MCPSAAIHSDSHLQKPSIQSSNSNQISSKSFHFASALVVHIFEFPSVAGKSHKRTRLETVKRIYEALKAGDAGVLHGLMVRHIEWWFHGPPECQHLMSILTGKCRPDCYNFKPHLMVKLLGEKQQQQQNQKNQLHHHHHHDLEEENGPQQKPEKQEEEEEEVVRVLVEGCSGCSSYWVHVWTVCIRHRHSHRSTERVTQLREYFNTSIVVHNFSPPTGSASGPASASDLGSASSSDSDSGSACSCSRLPLAVWESSILQRFPYPMPSLILAI